MAEAEFAARGDPSNLIDKIYSCAIAPQVWPAALREFAARVGGCAASILRISGEHAARCEAQWSNNRKFERAMRTAAARMSSLSMPCPLRPGKTFAVSGCLGYADLLNLGLGWDTILPKHISDIAVVPLTRDGNVVSVLIVLRPEEAGAYLPEEIRTIEAVSPHFRRAAAISSLLEFKPLGEKRSVGSFNRMPMAFILTDGAGRILHANAAAADMLDGCPLLCLEDELAARDGRSDAALRSAITNAAKAGRGTPGVRAKVTSLVVTGPGSGAIEVWVIPIAERFSPSPFLARSARVAVFARAVDAKVKTPGETARALSAMLGGDHRDDAAVSEDHIGSVMAQALRKPARPLSALSEMSVVRRADRLTRTTQPARAASAEC